MKTTVRSDAARVIRRALDEVSVIDPHCHMRPEKPAADTMADIVLYHHVWIELVSAGMGQREVTKAGMPQELEAPGMEPEERVGLSLQYLPLIRNTTLGLFLSWFLRDLYGLPRGLDRKNIVRACRLVSERGADPAWQESLLRERLKVERLVTVGRGSPCSDTVAQGQELAAVSLVSGKKPPWDVLQDLERELGREIRRARDYRDVLARAVSKAPTSTLVFLGLWLPPSLDPRLSGEKAVDAALRKVRSRQSLDPAEAGGLSFFAVRCVLEALRSTPLRTIQVIVGSEVLLPHRAITHWDGAFVGALARIAGAFEDFRFDVSTASDLYTQDLGILAKHVPNVSVVGYWWHTLYPRYIRKAVETRLDMVPMNKICAFFSDAYHLEWVYPKLKMVKTIWAEVLAERCDKGWYDLDTAVQIVSAVFHDNPKWVYGLG